jgi:ADP-heptose:LPS heptosyltransferase
MKCAWPAAVSAAGEKMFVLFPGALGDFICFLPALQVLAQDRNVALFARSEFAGLTPPTVRLHSLERYEIRRLFTPGAANDGAVRRFFAAYDRIYSWMGSRQEDFVRELSRLSNDRARIFPFRGDIAGMHQAEYYFSCVRQDGSEMPLPEIMLRPEAVSWSRQFWQRHGLENRPVLALAPGSGGREKIWPVDGFCAVADWWRASVDGEVLIILGPVEAERGGFEPLASRATVARDLDLAQAAALLSRSDVYLGNDSGITHLAAAAGVYTVAVFGPSDPQKWRPRGRHVVVIEPKARRRSGPNAETVAGGPGRFWAELPDDEVIAQIKKAREVASLTRWGSGITVFK